jgi:hypothetical protein
MDITFCTKIYKAGLGGQMHNTDFGLFCDTILIVVHHRKFYFTNAYLHLKARNLSLLAKT